MQMKLFLFIFFKYKSSYIDKTFLLKRHGSKGLLHDRGFPLTKISIQSTDHIYELDARYRSVQIEANKYAPTDKYKRVFFG